MNDQQIMIQTIRRLAERHPLQSLAPQQVWDEQLSRTIQQQLLDHEWSQIHISPSDKSDYDADTAAMQAGLLLWNDDLQASHELSQSNETPAGSLWHGMMHRMEGDYSNAKYWFRLAGKNRVYPLIQQSVADYLSLAETKRIIDQIRNEPIKLNLDAVLTQAEWNPYRMVDLVQQQLEHGSDQRTDELLRTIQHLEFIQLTNAYMHRWWGGGNSGTNQQLEV